MHEDFQHFHGETLPGWLSARASMPREYAESLQPFGLRVRGAGEGVTYSPVAGRIEIAPGVERARVVVELEEQQFDELVADLESVPGLIYGGRLRCERGNAMHVLRWEPALRWLYTGRPVYDPDSIDLRGRDGAPLDPTRGFTLDSDREEMAHYLRTVGYLWVREAFSADEVAALQAEAEILRERAVEGDQQSWWGRNEAGDAVLCRVLRAGVLPHMRALHGDRRIRDVVALCDVPMRPGKSAEEPNGIGVLWKQPGVREGLGDLPWHRDCGMGGHASMCPTAVASIFLGPNTPEAGELRFLPGSWQSSLPFFEPGEPGAPAGVGLPARPGDFTLHYGDGMHVAPPPQSAEGPFRSCALIGFHRDGARNHRGERHYNDALLGSEDGQVVHMRKKVEQL